MNFTLIRIKQITIFRPNSIFTVFNFLKCSVRDGRTMIKHNYFVL